MYQTDQFIASCSSVKNAKTGHEWLFEEFPDVFNDRIGKVKDFRVHIHIDKSIRPVAQPLRRVAYHVLKKADKAYDELLKNDIIEEVNEPSAWVSNVVIVPKPKKLDEVRPMSISHLRSRGFFRENKMIKNFLLFK